MTGTDARTCLGSVELTRATKQDRLARDTLDALPGRDNDGKEARAAAADPAQAPVLIRREVEVEHTARAVSRTVALATDQLCFRAQYTGLDLEAVPNR